MNILIFYFLTLFCFTPIQQQMHQRINHKRIFSENNTLNEFILPKMSYRDKIIKMLKLHKNTCQFGRIRPLQLFAPKAKALPKIKINNNNNSIYDSPLKYKKRQQIRHDSNSKIFSQSPTNLRVQPLIIQKIRTVDDKTGKESIQDNNNNNLKDQQKLRFFYTPSKTVINQDFSFATNTPGLACAFGLPIPIYNTPRKKCIPHSPLCGITFTCVMDVHAINEQGIEIENWWTLQVENETNN